MSFKRTLFDWPLLLFFMTTLWGVWIAYDRASAWSKWVYIIMGLALYYFIAFLPSRLSVKRKETVPAMELVLGLLPALLAIYFLLTNDWRQPVEKIAWLDPLRDFLAQRQLDLPWPRLHPNTAGGLLAILLPLAVCGLLNLTTGARRDVGQWVMSGLALGIAALGLLMSGLRGAWLALLAAVVLWGAWHLLDHLAARQRIVQGQRRWLVVGVWSVGLASALLLLWVTPWGVQLLGLRPDRLFVWRSSSQLMNDYLFTGVGLGNFTMAYSSYELLVHVLHTTHAHNLFLDIGLEHGLLGLFAVGWMVWNMLTAGRKASAWFDAGLIALGVIVIHGFLDDAFYGYGGFGATLLPLPLAAFARGVKPPETASARARSRQSEILSLVRWGILAALVVGGLSWPVARAAYLANLGALTQTQVELSAYLEGDWGVQDSLRRSPKIDLQPAIEYYQSALATDPSNAVAHQRLGQIALSQGRYAEARQHLEQAYLGAPERRSTRQLLGEAYAASGEVERAAALWRTITMDEGQLQYRPDWYRAVQAPQQAEWVAKAIQLSQIR